MNYKILGKGKIDIIIEMGLGSCIDEWIPIAEKLKNEHTILLYERAGINNSQISNKKRTPNNIADELHQLINKLDHENKITIIAHSAGGLYSIVFAKKYPELINKLILLDPLSINDNKFKVIFTPDEYKKSGVDKSTNFKILLKLAKIKLGFISKIVLKKAPPFCYYKFSNNAQNNILNSYKKVNNLKTIINEYEEAHNENNLKDIKNNFPNINIILITHSSELAIDENMKFGNNTKEFATKVEIIWQELMKEYLDFSDKSIYIQATNSTHFIHLTDTKLLIDSIKK